jgi:hypothetical protein
MNRGDRLRTMKRVSKEVFEAESDDVKDEVKKKLQEIIDAAAAARAEEHVEVSVTPGTRRTPSQYQLCVFIHFTFHSID